MNTRRDRPVLWRIFHAPARKIRHNARPALVVLAAVAALAGCSGGPSPELVQARESLAQAREKAEALHVDMEKLRGRVDEYREREEKLTERADELDERAGKLEEKGRKLDRREEEIKAAELEIEENTIPGDGVFLVGEDIEPGTYASEGGTNCYWARLSSTSGNDILANGLPGGPVTVTISESDAAFETSHCGEWRLR